MAKKYDNESIASLKGPDRVRKRPGVIFGSDDLEGCEHSVFEILSNAVDEAREGFGKHITLTKYEDGSIEVADEGRGIPIEWNPKEERYNWDLVFCELYAGGKNDNAGNYEYALGLNGLGTCSTQYASAFMDVTVYRDGTEYKLHFEKGVNKTEAECGYLTAEAPKRKSGTVIRWLPDREVFTEIDIPVDYFVDIMKRQAVVNNGIKFTFRLQKGKTFETTDFLYENGVVDYVSELAGEKAMTGIHSGSTERTGRDREDRPEYKVKINYSFCFTQGKPRTEYYHNSSWLEHGGSPDKAARAAFVSAIDNFIKQIGKYNKGESKITFQDVDDSLVLITNCFSTLTSYENQTKKSINNKFIQDAMTEFMKEDLLIFFTENRMDATKIAEQVLINKRAREHAERTRVSIKTKLTGSMDITNRVQKFVDCRTKDVSKRELYIVEGDSALGSVKQGRDSEFQAIMPVRGKILNCLKVDLDRIFKSEVITDLLRVLGCGVEVEHKSAKNINSFSLDQLRWNKVIICTDADVDGYQIRTLILTMIYRLVPTLIKEGYVYIAESPLYEITYKDKSYFAYDEAEKAQILQKLEGKKVQIQRSKGLGENEAEMMWETTMSPETRRLIRVNPEDAEKMADTFDLLLGNNLAGRKQYITEHGSEYLDVLDIS